eukprot:332953-Chlamydomonas_euryale.AAC.3
MSVDRLCDCRSSRHSPATAAWSAAAGVLALQPSTTKPITFAVCACFLRSHSGCNYCSQRFSPAVWPPCRLLSRCLSAARPGLWRWPVLWLVALATVCSAGHK